MKTRPHDSTTPTTECTVGEVVDGRLQTYYSNGLTKREYFAGLAMSGMLANTEFTKIVGRDGVDDLALAKLWIKTADALIKALNSEDK